MSNAAELESRCGGQCELCASGDDLQVFSVPNSEGHSDAEIMLCTTCRDQIAGSDDTLDANHWRCLNDSMWSAVPAVQIMAWRMLKRLSGESWAQDLLEMLYLDEDMSAWAQSGVQENSEAAIVHKDSNGAVLAAGDTVTIIKDLNVKGTSFVAKRGTAVRNISLTDNPEHIEGRVNGTRIVILTCFVKKS